jgi:hypothetical protein
MISVLYQQNSKVAKSIFVNLTVNCGLITGSTNKLNG